MKIARIVSIVGGLLVVGAAIAFCGRAPVPEPPPTGPRMAAAFALTGFLEVQTRIQAGVLPAIQRTIENADNYPIAAYGAPGPIWMGPLGGTLADGAILPTPFDSVHEVPILIHPTIANRYALPLSPRAKLVLDRIRLHCAASIDAGQSVPGCAIVASLPTVEASLDATWVPDASAASAEAPSCPDDFAGAALPNVTTVSLSL
jgi:hypothetical protein